MISDSVLNSQQNIREENVAALKKLRAELEAEHQASVNQLKAVWSKEKETEMELQVKSQVALAEAKWKEELQKVCFPVFPILLLSLNGEFMSHVIVFLFLCRCRIAGSRSWRRPAEISPERPLR